MISVTGEYLINIIERYVNTTISLRRKGCSNAAVSNNPNATNEELADFILSVPYLDEKIKNFILEIAAEKTIIISQAWEIAFMLRVARWAENTEWLQGAFRLSMATYNNNKNDQECLTLPY